MYFLFWVRIADAEQPRKAPSTLSDRGNMFCMFVLLLNYRDAVFVTVEHAVFSVRGHCIPVIPSKGRTFAKTYSSGPTALMALRGVAQLVFG